MIYGCACDLAYPCWQKRREMYKRDPFWKRAFSSVRQFLTQPMGGSRQGAAVKGTQSAPAAEEMQELAQAEAVKPPPKRHLWGQEFDVVEEGLAQEQVSDFVDTLMVKCRALEEQQKHFLSLGSLTEKAAIEADKAAAGIRSRAKGEAEAEAARIVAEANQKTQEMMTEAKMTAQEVTQQEVQNILQAALRKAAIVELQAKQQGQLFLIRSRDAIEGDLREEVKEAYYRLLSGLHNVLGEGNRLELGWKDRTAQLRQRDTYELAGPESTRSALRAEISRTAPLIGGEGDEDVGMAGGFEEWRRDE